MKLIQQSYDIINNNDNFREWGNLTDFQLYVISNTEFIRTYNDKYYIIYEGLAYEIIGNNLLQLYFSNWLDTISNFMMSSFV